MPIDSVSSAMPGGRELVLELAQQREAPPLQRGYPVVGSGIAISPRRRRRGSARRLRASASVCARRDAALAGFAADVDLDAALAAAAVRRAARRTGARRFSPGRRCAPSRNARRSARVLLLWIGPMKCQSMARSRECARSCRALPARSSRRTRAGRRHRPRATASAAEGLADREQRRCPAAVASAACAAARDARRSRLASWRAIVVIISATLKQAFSRTTSQAAHA